MANRNTGSPQTTATTARYRALIIFISLFVFSSVSILALNFGISQQFEADALDINLAGRQRMLSQRIAKSVAGISEALRDGTDPAASINELDTSFQLFDRTLTAFSVGGTTTGADGEAVELAAVEGGDGRLAIDGALAIWSELGPQVQTLLTADNQIALAEAASVSAVGNETVDLLRSKANELTVALDRAADEPTYVNYAGRLRMLALQLDREVGVLAAGGFADRESLLLALDEVGANHREFDMTVDAFSQGGPVVSTQGSHGLDVAISAITDPSARRILDELIDIWGPIDEVITAFLADDNITVALATLSQVQRSTTANNTDLLRLMNQLTVALEQASAARSNLLRYIQAAGIVTALLMFAFIVFVFIRRLRESDAETDRAKGETDRILATVKNGLFLLSDDYKIGQQHSQSLPTILGQDQVADANFISLMQKIVPEQTLSTASDYLDLLFGEHVNENLVTDINPLDEVEVYFEDESGDFQTKHLEFSFKRVAEAEKTSHLLVQVDDISERVRLDRELKESQAKAQAQFDMMLKVLHVEPQALGEFLNGTTRRLTKINAILRDRAKTTNQQMRSKVDDIFREMHSIKGEAATLGLDSFEDRAHQFENMLDDLRQSPNLSGGDFLPLAIRLDEFMSSIDSLRELIHRLGAMQIAVNGEAMVAQPGALETTAAKLPPMGAERDGWLASYTRFVDELANTHGKQVDLRVQHEQRVPERLRSPLKDIVIQLIRNSIAHGIEAPEARTAVGKASSGCLDVDFAIADGKLRFTFQDDGRGLSEEAIRETALARGLCSQQALESMSKRQLFGLIFRPGFSTANGADKTAGRGVGMDIIAAKAKDMGAAITLGSTKGKNFRLGITFPIHEKETTTAMENA